MMKTHRITGGGGVALHVVETGNPRGRPILFLHGFSQCWLQWRHQLESELADECRLIAPDLRGHGLSDRPRDGYDDARQWAEDVHAIITTLDLQRPVLCGWSYGPLVFLDYVRHYGEERIGGLHFVGAITKLGSEDAVSVLTPEVLGLVPQFFATDTEPSVRGLAGLVRLCFAGEPSDAERYLMLGYNLAVPPHVRQALFSRSFHNDDLLPKLRTPVLITHGAADAIVKPFAVDLHKRAMPHSEVQIVEGAGHAVFWERPQAFNERLRAFVAAL